jgi:CubicO group peptidase (beta-lactamase class C family)
MCVDAAGARTDQGWPGLPPLSVLNSATFRAAGNPAGGVIASAVAVARWYQGLLARRAIDDDSPFRVATTDIENANTDVRFDAPANWGLGFAIAGAGPSYLRAVFGTPASDETFGHNGTGGQVCWADPRSGVSFAYLTNQLDFDVDRARRRWSTVSTAAATLAGTARPTPSRD